MTALLQVFCGQAQVAIWTYHANNQRTGLNPAETILTPANVSSNTFGTAFSYAVDGYVYAEPLYVPGVNIQGRGVHNAIFVATEHNTIYAFDANNPTITGGLLWQISLGPAAVSTWPDVYTNFDFGGRYDGSYTDIQPEVGVTGTPVIETNSGTLYVDDFTAVPGVGITNYFHTLHALNITNGAEQPYSPVVVTASVPGAGVESVGGRVIFDARQEIQRCALTLANGIVYLAYAGYSDTDPYHGWIIGYNATNLVQLTNYVFNTTPNSSIAGFGDNAGEGGIWMGGGGLAVDTNLNLYFEVGNGSFNATNGSGNTEYGDSFMKLSTTNGLAAADYFTPWNQEFLQDNDVDVGSGGLMLVPDQAGPHPHVLLGAGKQGQIYVINRDQFTLGNNHYDATNVYDFVLQTNIGYMGSSFDTPAYFSGNVYYIGDQDTLKAFPISRGALFPASIVEDTATLFQFPGATPSASANGTNHGIVWALNCDEPQELVACNATNVAKELYTSDQAPNNRDHLGEPTKFATPTVADGEVFCGGASSVTVFGLLAGTFSFSASAYTTTQTSTNAVITVNRLGGARGPARISYATTGGTATNGHNYTAVSGTLNWTDGEWAHKSFSVPILNDGMPDSNLTVTLQLSNPTNIASALGLQTNGTITIFPSPTVAWKYAHFGVNENSTNAADGADPDRDKLVNLLEYAYATDPNVANTNPFSWQLSGKAFQLHFRRNISASDLTYLIQSSRDLVSWSNVLAYSTASGWTTNLTGASLVESTSNGVPPNQYVNVTATVSTNVMTAPKYQFLRIGVYR